MPPAAAARAADGSLRRRRRRRASKHKEGAYGGGIIALLLQVARKGHHWHRCHHHTARQQRSLGAAALRQPILRARARPFTASLSACGATMMTTAMLFTCAATSLAAAAPPATPAGWSHFPGKCMGPFGCTKSHCDCSSPPAQLAFSTCDSASCFSKAYAACKATSKCNSFGWTGKMGGGRYELWTLTNWSAVPNSDWNSYAMNSPVKPAGWTPAPPPAPECTPGPSTCKPAPAGSVFPPPGDFPPGCNHKGCTTVPTLLPTWTPTYQMNKSTIIMPCNGTGPTDPQSTKGWAYVDFDCTLLSLVERAVCLHLCGLCCFD
jgi:hypothetical protein